MEYVKAIEYPIPGEKYFMSLSLPQKNLEGLGADKKLLP
jgi:hypothetical protein